MRKIDADRLASEICQYMWECILNQEYSLDTLEIDKTIADIIRNQPTLDKKRRKDGVQNKESSR